MGLMSPIRTYMFCFIGFFLLLPRDLFGSEACSRGVFESDWSERVSDLQRVVFEDLIEMVRHIPRYYSPEILAESRSKKRKKITVVLSKQDPLIVEKALTELEHAVAKLSDLAAEKPVKISKPFAVQNYNGGWVLATYQGILLSTAWELNSLLSEVYQSYFANYQSQTVSWKKSHGRETLALELRMAYLQRELMGHMEKLAGPKGFDQWRPHLEGYDL